MKKLNPTLSGVAGEYFVAAELSRRGYIASLTLRNTRGLDILASNADNTRRVGIQVKAKRGRGPKWMLNKKDVEASGLAANLVFVFVCLNEQEAPSYYIVPRQTVASIVCAEYDAWRKVKGHRDTSIRNFRDPGHTFLGKWELLGLDAAPSTEHAVKMTTEEGE